MGICKRPLKNTPVVTSIPMEELLREKAASAKIGRNPHNMPMQAV
jgi:hypothetical protein